MNYLFVIFCLIVLLLVILTDSLGILLICTVTCLAALALARWGGKEP